MKKKVGIGRSPQAVASKVLTVLQYSLKRPPMAYQQDSGMVASDPVIKRFDLRLETRTSRTTRRDYDFEIPRITLEADNRELMLVVAIQSPNSS